MKRPNPPPPSEFALEVEIARRRALHHVHDSSRVLVDVMHFTDTNHRQAYTEIVGALNTIEQRLIDLDPKTAQAKQPG
jgi:hypothetical protein